MTGRATSARPTSTSTAWSRATTGDNTVFDEDFDDAPDGPGQESAGARRLQTCATLEREMSGAERMGSRSPMGRRRSPTTSPTSRRSRSCTCATPTRCGCRRSRCSATTTSSSRTGSTCHAPARIPDPGCCEQNPGFAWNHGDDQPEIASTWQGWVGPECRTWASTASLWTDHTDAQPDAAVPARPEDDYTDDGRAITQIMTPAATPARDRGRPTPATTRCRPPTSSSTRRSASLAATA